MIYDVRQFSETQITKVMFAEKDADLDTAVQIQYIHNPRPVGSGPYIKLTDEDEDHAGIIKISDIDNLILALKKAKEVFKTTGEENNGK